MQLIVTFKALDTYDNSRGVPPRQSAVGSMLQEALGGGRIVAGGCFADLPGGFFVVEVESADELAETLGQDLLDGCHVEINRVTALEKVAAHFDQWYQTQQPSPASRDA